MNDKKFIIIVVAATVALLGGGIYLAAKMEAASQVEANPQSKAVTGKTFHDWGEIGLDAGNVEQEFAIKNEGSEPLSLSDVTTSCSCTTAQLSLGEENSPVFGMHTKSNYKMEVPAGETAKLKVIFDPAFHGPSGVGPVSRQVKVATNDPENPELTFMLTAMVKK